ncbi:class I SAM-dependent methyltransferase [Sphingomonas sp.]|uniref:class I SAM-dependent methyltransferase n=1 Tax=Sphingomonas sp. TaxID=28214 RepID=UPI00286E7C8F|nr:class I SAM-dependent methyltransferase [Sphingomonas sp.]
MGHHALSDPPALSDPVASTSQWDAADYARLGGFVPALGAAALDLLDPQPGEHILDVGCGDGSLTQQIVERGASVVGIDNSLSMIGAARARGLDARLMDAAQLKFAEAFDAAFSNATLHWVLDKERAARAIWFALKPGGRFAGEMGGEGNLARLREALDEVLVLRGYGPPTFAANWYPSVEEFLAVYEAAGFTGEIDARLVERPTPLEHGVAAWVTTFRAGWLDRAGVPHAERAEIAAAVADAFDTDVADYVRLRFIMRKPD